MDTTSEKDDASCCEMLQTEDVTPEQAAKYFKYLQQFKLSYIVNKLELRRVPSRSFYCNHKKQFDALVAIFKKYDMDVIEYIKFFVTVSNKLERCIQEELVSVKTFNAFITYLKAEDRKNKVFEWFMKSANNIADDCIALDYLSTKDYLRELIATRKLASYYLTGKISKYWFAAIPTFKKIILKLDKLSKDEFSDVLTRFDIYNTEINEAFLKMKKCKVNPIKFTDELIFQRRCALQKSK